MKNYGNIIVYPKDVHRITGRTERYGRKLLNRIKVHLNKQSHHFVTLEEFCNYTGLDIKKLYNTYF